MGNSIKEMIFPNTDSNTKLLSLDAQDKLFLERIAKKIHGSGFVTPAVFFLEMTKPLTLLGSHALVFLGPILNAFIQLENYYRTVQVLEDPENIELLLQMIEALETDAKIVNGDNHE
jgi:hypothetical protein|tara:strand:- start:361 stop:711 length:351 start_codon:yes stop_codon:yes gene_type:complete